ncbi:MAG: hypothetical protein JST75_04300 [Bacteroidetes bacterium]|nr:hypothetical protein [Bacteroidota bacterium]
MQSNEALIGEVRKIIEAKTGWGVSDDWTNQDFVALSEKIQEQTGVAISHVTLKRIWGKVKYDSLPNTHTLNTLVQFVGYKSWRDFKLQHGSTETHEEIIPAEKPLNGHAVQASPRKISPFVVKALTIAASIIAVIVIIQFIFARQRENVNPSDYAFSSKKVVTEGVPNSVVFDYDATKAPLDSSIIFQQSWDTTYRTKVSKNQHQHTNIYYYPDYYEAKLLVGHKIVKEHNVLITSGGWLPLVVQKPVPAYFKKEDAMVDGKFSLSIDKIKSRNIHLGNDPLITVYSHVRDFGEIYSDDFVFETYLKNDFSEGTAICQKTIVYLLCEGTAIGIPLCIKGCVSDIDLLFTDFFISGKQKNLSAFGVDFSKYVKIRIESKNGKAKIFVDDALAYEVTDHIKKAKIIGFDYVFYGTGSVDYVKMSSPKMNYDEEF